MLVDHPADFIGNEVGIGARRLVALVAPGLVRGHRLAADELQRLGARLVAQGLALQVGGDGEDFQAVLLGQLDPLLGVRLGPGVGAAAVQVELPARLFPAVEAGVLEELQPLVHRHVAELAADQADLVVRSLAEAMLGGLLVAHAIFPFGRGSTVRSAMKVTILPIGRPARGRAESASGFRSPVRSYFPGSPGSRTAVSQVIFAGRNRHPTARGIPRPAAGGWPPRRTVRQSAPHPSGSPGNWPWR